ncbi:MAG TPA: sugar ABC transporter permease [Anaerolineales bacterium]|nr:sugar ABC transporter permease [Anaerolineales bacterium]
MSVPKIMDQGKWTPWMYLSPALIIMFIFIVFPMGNTMYLSLRNRDSSGWASSVCVEGQTCWGVFENYRYALTSELDTSSPGATWRSFWFSSFGNNLKWIAFMVSGAIVVGLIVAVLTDRVRYESAAKSIIFLPMAISFVGAGVIWKFVYNFNAGGAQIGLLNAILARFGFDPVAFLQTIPINTYAIIAVGVWMWAGFCMTILSAALKGVPTDIIEAARVDGASEWTIFWRVMIPMIRQTLTVVATTMVIIVLKLFDLVFVMTGGNFRTDVIANRMYAEMYINQHSGRGTAVAVVLILLTIPFIILNVKRFREEEALR